MRSKRHFDESEFQEFPVKNPKQLNCGNKPTCFGEDLPSYEATEEAEIPGLLDKDYEDSAPSSWFTIETREEDVGSAFCSTICPDYFELGFPRRAFIQFEDTYSSLLNHSPKKLVPVGPDHQADVPEWDLDAMNKHSSDFSDNVKKFMGTCVTAMPDSKLLACNHIKSGNSRLDCSCPDEGSIRCVRQHVKEARGNLRETLGYEAFVDLGFSDMGEEVACKWTKEEQGMFHEVVYSNPASFGKKFWNHLEMMFPYRTKNELVSYYFNVFMLQRRAVQNRSHLLEIDSDNDEWQGNDEPVVKEEDEDSAVESPIDPNIGVGLGVDSLDEIDDEEEEQEEEEEEEENDNGDDRVAYDIGSDGGRNPKSNDEIEEASLDDNSGFNFLVHGEVRIPGSTAVEFDVQEDSCLSYDGQPYANNTVKPGDMSKSDRGGCLPENTDVPNDSLVTEYVLQPCDSKVWDTGILHIRTVQ